MEESTTDERTQSWLNGDDTSADYTLDDSDHLVTDGEDLSVNTEFQFHAEEYRGNISKVVGRVRLAPESDKALIREIQRMFPDWRPR